MTFKNFLKFSTIVFVFTMVLSSLAFGQTRYLNSTDGDDSYDGTSPTHDSPTVGPKRTLTGAFTAFGSGTTVYMTAGNYIYNQSGIGGGNDAAGYTLGTGANKSMTFIVTTYNSNNVVSLSTGPLVINCGTGTIAFQAAAAGVQSVSFTGASMTFTSGTLNVTGITFNAGAGMGTITVTDGAFAGSPVYANSGIALTYNGTTSKTAGAELPATLASITLSQTATSTVTFNSAVTFGTSGGGITNTTTPNRNATFNGLVTLTSAVTTATSTINNSQNTDTWTFAGGVTVNSSIAANGNVITNSGTGTVAVSGALTFTQIDATGTNDGNNTSTVQNTGTGTLSLTGGVLETPTASGAPSKFTASRTSVVNFSNAAAGSANVGGGTSTTFTGTFTTGAAAGTVNLTGPVTVSGAFTNGATHTVSLGANNLTLQGAIANGGTISSAGVGSGYVIIAANSTDATGGSWPNIRNTATGGAYAITTAATLSGNVENTASSTLTILGAATITGGVSLSGSGGITLGAAGTNVNGNVSVTGSGTFTTTVTTIGGTTTMSSGGITLGGNVTLMGAYTQNGGTLNFGGANTLDVKNNFTRNVGTVTPATGTLQFSAGGSQTFSGGTNLEVWNFGVTGVGTGVTFVNGSLMVDNNATIVSNTNVILGSYNIRMEGLNAPLGVGKNTFSNAGQYTSTGGGGVIFENPSAGAASVGYLTGNGVNSNIEIRLANETDNIQVSAATVVTWSGLLTLSRGTILVTGGGAQLNPATTLTTPTIQRNLGDANTDGNADGHPISLAAGGVFNATNVSYNLTYYNLNTMVVGGSNVGPEFVTGANARVINFTNNATGAPVKLPVAGALYKFSGNLKIANSAEVQLGGALGVDDLVSTGTGVTHTIIGLLSRTGTATFSLVGDGTINGGTNTTAPADASTIADMTVNTSTTSATYNINNLKAIGVAGADGLTLNAGTVNLGMLTYGAGPTIGSVRNATVNAGALKLTANATLFVNFTLNGGTFDFANFTLYANNAGIATVAATGGAFAATGATTGGYLRYSASGNLNTGSILVPRILIANGSTLTLTGNSGVSDIFTDYDATPTAGTLALGANTFVVAGGTWNAIGTYTGTGKIQETGATNINLGASITVPNFELKNTTNTANLVNNTGTSTNPSLTVGTLFTSTSGNLNLNACDVILTNAGVAFSYAAGTFTATTSNTITASDNANGEFVFNNAAAQTFNVTATGLVFPNVRIAGAGTMTLAAAPNNNAYTISNRLVIASTGSLTNGANSLVTFGDGALIKRMNNGGVITENPVFAGAIDIQYAAAAGITQAKEAPATIRNLYVTNGAGIAVASAKNVTVTGTLYLYTGNYDFEAVGGTIYTITMGTNSTVNVRDGNLINSGSATVTPLAGGPVTLTYSNTLARTTSGREYPSTALFVAVLNVLSDDGVGGAKLLTLGASRSCGDFVLNTNSSGPQNTARFDLSGGTLTVTNTTSATLTRGVLSSEAGGGVGVANTAGTLASAGTVSSTANTSVQNVNITAVTLNLAGAFGQTAYAPATVTATTGATVSGTSTIAAFNGNLTSTGTVTINGAHSGGTITASADVTVAAGGSMAASSNLAFVGTNNATLTVPAAGAAIGAITFNKTNNTNTVTLAGGNLRAGALTTFVNGLFLTGSNTFNLNVPAFGGGQGFTRVGVTGTNISHVVGNVAKTLYNAGGPGLAGSPEPRQEFPVGSMTQYKLVAITFNPAFGLPTTPNATLMVGYNDANPNGAVNLPIKDGVATGIDVSKYPNFYWTIASAPFSIGPTTPFDLELTATGFTNFDDINNVRILRRYGGVADVTNQWLLQGSNTSYDNSVNAGVPTVIQRGANAGLRVGGAVFTLGLKSNMKINPNSGIVKYINTYKKLWLVLNQGVKGYNISDLVTGNIGSLTFVANSSNNSIATAAAAGSTLQITPVAVGDVVVTVIAQDLTYNDFFAYSINVNVGLTDVQSPEQLPTEFALFQNYPNPFNPTTNIKFDLPKESNVTLKVYNILGEEVATLVNKVMPAGHQVVTFDASRLASGMYIYRIEAGNFVSVKKMLLMK